jgi:hypothetical protein
MVCPCVPDFDAKVEGALYCWGFNTRGCCGQSPALQFVAQPECVRFLYDMPANLARGKEVRQSSTMGKSHAGIAIDGIINGGDPDVSDPRRHVQPLSGLMTGDEHSTDRVDAVVSLHEQACTCTKPDNNAWWQVDLGDYATVHSVIVWNRCDPHGGMV